MLQINRKYSVIAILAIFLFATSCSKYQKLLKSTDNNLKLEKAIEYYDKGDFSRAIGLFADIIPAFRGTATAEKINYYYAMAHYKIRDYDLASQYFRTFSQSFPLNEHAEEFLFLAAYCKFLMAPRSSLDQTTTIEAIRDFQIFVNRFPASARVEEANRLIDVLRQRQEKKIYDLAQLYFNISDYVAAATTFNTLIRDFPDTKLREEALFNIGRANFEYAQMSIPERQAERFAEVINAHNRLMRQFPQSRFKDQSERLRNNAQARIDQLSQNN